MSPDESRKDEAAANAFMLSIVIPAHNEEAVIESTLRQLYQCLTDEHIQHELCVVDDHSTDTTWSMLGELGKEIETLRPLQNKQDGGYGMAVRAGLNHFEGDGVIITMADGSDSPEDIVAYCRALQAGYDCAFGTRFTQGTAVEGYPLVKKLLNRTANKLIAWLTGLRSYNDFTNGFKGYSRAMIESMQPLISADFNLTVEMSIKAALAHPKIKVIPNNWRDREGGESKFVISKLGPRYLMTILYCLIENYVKNAGARKYS